MGKVRLRRSADLPALDDAREGLLEAMGLAGPGDVDVHQRTIFTALVNEWLDRLEEYLA